MNQQLAEWIYLTSGFSIAENHEGQAVAGGCINDCRIYQTDGPAMFIKFNHRSSIDLFEAEAQGLKLLRDANVFRIPDVFGFGVVGNQAVLLLEAIDLRSRMEDSAQAELGRQLAALHQCESDDQQFGLSFDNHIGKTPQPNSKCSEWVGFFIQNRLDYQFKLAATNGWKFNNRAKLYQAVENLLGGDYRPKPSLLHGDLWGGNYAFDESSRPVLFDPAVYYGDREADVAFTKMFGGFTDAFYQAYREIHPATSRTEHVHQLYNLYHLLNHYNLFGGSYRQQAEQIIVNFCN